MSVYELKYADKGTALVLNADLDKGWRKLRKTYGFNASQKIHYRDDWSIRAQLSLIAQPATFDNRAASFPGATIESNNKLVAFTLNLRQLAVKVALREEQPWQFMSNGRPGLFIESLPFLLADPKLWFDLRVWIVFHSPPPAPVPDIREWCQRLFVPGGQFESNRRRH